MQVEVKKKNKSNKTTGLLYTKSSGSMKTIIYKSKEDYFETFKHI